MAKSEVTTNTITSIISNPEKLKQFQLVADTRTEREYIEFVSTSIFTYIGMKANISKFPMINELCDKSQADISYLIELLAKAKTKDSAFRIRPIIELYENLLKENWKVVKYERDVLNATESYNYTADGNMAICDAIINFLKEYVLNKTHNSNITF